jgi:hypothetical protein
VRHYRLQVIAWECPGCSSKAGTDCVKRNGGSRRWPHLPRILLSLSYLGFVTLASRLSYQARADALFKVTGHDWLPAIVSAESAAGEVNAWDRAGDALRVSARLVHRADDVIAHESGAQPVLDTSGLRHRLTAIAEEVARAAGLCAQASFEPDTAGLARLAPDVLAAELSARELARFDQTLLSRIPVPAPGPDMSVSYRGGQITATMPSDAGVITWTGYAPTPAAAYDVLATATSPAVPAIHIDPPVMPVREAAQFTPGSEPEPFDLLSALLEHGGPELAEHLRACRERRDQLAATDLKAYLQKRADELNTADPQIELDLDGLAYDRELFAWVHAVQWVPTRVILHTPNPVWGYFEHGRHPQTLTEITEGLITSGDLVEFTRRFFTIGEIQLNRIPGPAGPLYTLNQDGTHRVHAARLLDLPWLLARVNTASLPTTITLEAAFARDPARPRNRGITDRDLTERRDLWQGLLRRGLIAGELEHPTGLDHIAFLRLRWQRLPAPWWLFSPAHAARINHAYEQRYPGALAALDIPAGVSMEPHAWTAWLLG